MDFSVPVLAPQCKMMNIGGVDIIGNPSSGVIVGLDEEGLSIVNKLRKHRLTRAHREKQLKMSCQALHNAPPNRT